MTLEQWVLGWPIRVQLTYLDNGIHVLITGGCCTHVGSVSVASSEMDCKNITLPGHKETVVSDRWATALTARYHCPVTVVCGIHYDTLNHRELELILDTLEQMLCQLMENGLPALHV